LVCLPVSTGGRQTIPDENHVNRKSIIYFCTKYCAPATIFIIRLFIRVSDE